MRNELGIFFGYFLGRTLKGFHEERVFGIFNIVVNRFFTHAVEKERGAAQAPLFGLNGTGFPSGTDYLPPI